MQQSRLFEIVYILLDRPGITAAELAERFEVSVRTVYRDIEKLCEAGIPVYAERGRNGGIRLVDRFVLNKSLLSQQEQASLLSAVQGLSATNFPEAKEMADKLKTLFQDHSANWIEVDLSDWKTEEREKFETVKTAVQERRIISFDYYSTAGEKTTRAAEPLQLWFKGRAWYLRAYCTSRQAERLFKLSRMKHVTAKEETFLRELSDTPPFSENYPGRSIRLRLRIDAAQSYRVYDEFETEQITGRDAEGFIIETDFIESEWIYGYLLSYGPYLEVLEPERVRKKLIEDLKKTLNRY